MKKVPQTLKQWGGILGPNGAVAAKCEVRSGKMRIIGPFLVQSTLSGSFGPNFGFWALKENLVGVGSLRPVGGSGMLLWVAGGRGSVDHCVGEGPCHAT